MTFRVTLCCGLLFLVCLVLVGAVKSRPVVGDGCVSMEKYKCGEEDCNCHPARSSLWPGLAAIYRKLFSFQSLMSPSQAKKCDKCDIQCEKRSVIACKNGVCLQGRCSCLPCWKGESCGQPDYSSPPKFEQSLYEVEIPAGTALGSLIITVAAFDRCGKDHPLTQITYSITKGNDAGLFQINEKNGRIHVVKSLQPSAGEVMEFTVEAAKGDAGELKATAHVRVSVKEIRSSRRRRSAHHIERRSLATALVSPSLVLNTIPVITNNTFYKKGDTINFNISLSHNASAVLKAPTENLAFRCTSTYLTATLPFTSTGAPVTTAAVVAGDGTLTFTVNPFNDADTFQGSFGAKVKDTILPLSNLFFQCSVLGQKSGGEYKVDPKPSFPTLYAVFPKVTLEKTTYRTAPALNIKSTPKYRMNITMPTLDFPLLVEISTAINDFSFMAVYGVIVVSTGTSIAPGSGGNLRPTPVYYKSKAELAFSDRSVLDFGNLTVTPPGLTNNQIVIEFDVNITDHPLLANGSKHWVGAGMRSGYQMLWVGQEAVYVLKNEPTVAVYFATQNDTSATRYFMDDRLSVTFTLNHTTTSTADAQNIVLKCYSKYLNFINASYTPPAGSLTSIALHNSTALASVSIPNFVQGSIATGGFELKVNDQVNPLVELNVYCQVSYQNMGGENKMKTTHKPAPPYVAGVPVFSLNKTTSGPHRIGSKVCFKFKLLLRKMVSPLVLEVIAPINGSAIFSIHDISSLTVGTNIIDRAAILTKQFQYRSTVNDTLFDRANIDLGTVKSIVGSANSPDNEISFTFCALVNDHANVTNGSKYWIGVGVKGGQRMMWIGEVAVVADVPVDRKPVLKCDVTCTVPGSQQHCSDVKLERGSTVQYNVTIRHDADSQQYAQNIKSLVMIPPYVKFQANGPMTDRLTHAITQGGPQYTHAGAFRFLDKLQMSFTASLDPDRMMPPGNTMAVSVAEVTFTGDGIRYRLPLMPVSAEFSNPGGISPSPPPQLQEYYSQGIYVDVDTNTLYICRANENSLKSSCFYSTDCVSGVWIPMDTQVACIIGKQGSKLYAVSKNRRAYMVQTARGRTWLGITTDEWTAVKGAAAMDKLFAIPDSNTDTSDTPPSWFTGASAQQFGANKKGIFCRTNGAASWSLKAQWKCCGN